MDTTRTSHAEYQQEYLYVYFGIFLQWYFFYEWLFWQHIEHVQINASSLPISPDVAGMLGQSTAMLSLPLNVLSVFVLFSCFVCLQDLSFWRLT